MSAKNQIDKLANFIMAEFPEYIKDGGAGDVAIEVMKALRKRVGELEGRCSRLSTSCGMAGYRLDKAKRTAGKHYCRYREMLEAQVADCDSALTRKTTTQPETEEKE